MRLLIIVDYQYDFVKGSLGFSEALALEDKIYKKAQEYLNNNDEIVFTLDTHDEDYLTSHEGKNLPIKHTIKNTLGHEIFGKINTLPGKRFYKPSFASLDLLAYLQNKDYTSIELVGVVTNMCVISNACLAKAACRESEIIIDAACCASFDEELHQKALDIMASLQMKIINRG